jgi:hypothetical protein
MAVVLPWWSMGVVDAPMHLGHIAAIAPVRIDGELDDLARPQAEPQQHRGRAV